MWLLIPILVYCVVFLYVRHVYSYWRRKGFPHEKSNITWSYLKNIYNREFHYVQAITDAYQAGKEHFVGIYFLFRPTLIIRDLSLARLIMEDQNGHFNDTKWDYIRSYRKFNLLEKLSPIFSAARLEGMFRNIEKVGDHMLNQLNAMISLSERKGSDDIDMQHLLRM